MALHEVDLRDGGDAGVIDSLLRDEVNAPELYPTSATLPGGWVGPDNRLHKDVELRELTGTDEEILSRILAKADDGAFVNWLNKIVLLGVTSIGGFAFNEEILENLLVGDRDFLFLQVRAATYGDDYETNIICPVCGRDSDVVFERDDIKITTIDDAEEVYRTVQLRKGHVASIRLVRVADQALASSDATRTTKEWNTILLGRCVQTIDHQGTLGEQTMRAMGSADRLRLTTYLREHQPGPRLGEVVAACPKCNQDSSITLSMAAMFP